jgi:3',5'-cyclic AMP phosphodiesterase CpdA
MHAPQEAGPVMDARSMQGRVRLMLVAGAMIGCWTDLPAEAAPSTPATLRAIGRRLSRSFSARELTAIASRVEALLALLQPSERSALGRGYFRFQVDMPVILDVAVPRDSAPFWIKDQRFVPTHQSLCNADGAWELYRKSFASGWIGLGVNGLDRNPPAHYVVFIRPLNPGSAAGHQPIVGLDAARAEGWSQTVARSGVSAAHDVHKPFASLPADLDGAILLRPSHGRRHSALLATGPIWKTHVVSGRQPDQVAIAYGSDPGRELVWSWRTSPEVIGTVLCLAQAPVSDGGSGPVGPDPSCDAHRLVLGDSVCLEFSSVLNDPVVRRHRVAVDGLDPDTTYWYRLGDGSPRGWGPWRTIKTAPARSQDVRLLYLGDAQTGLERWGRLLQTAYRRHPRIDFIVMAGDLVDRGNERTNWDHLFLRASAVFDRVPVMPCAGNHEYLDCGPRLYRAFFELPRNGPTGIDPELVYSFEAGDACLVVLDSTLADCDPAAARRQAAWLDATLGRTKAAWKLAVFHHPVYPSHPWRDTPALREVWVPILDKHHVDLVLQGHDHAYLRTYPLRDHRRVDEPAQGTTYVIAVSGDKFVDQAPRDYIQVGRTSISTYQTIDLDAGANRLTYRAWTEDGQIIDEMTIQKARQRGASG